MVGIPCSTLREIKKGQWVYEECSGMEYPWNLYLWFVQQLSTLREKIILIRLTIFFLAHGWNLPFSSLKFRIRCNVNCSLDHTSTNRTVLTNWFKFHYQSQNDPLNSSFPWTQFARTQSTHKHSLKNERSLVIEYRSILSKDAKKILLPQSYRPPRCDARGPTSPRNTPHRLLVNFEQKLTSSKAIELSKVQRLPRDIDA